MRAVCVSASVSVAAVCRTSPASRMGGLLRLQKVQGHVLRAFSANLPKHEVVGMPALSPTMKSGTVSAWLKKEGDQCGPGDVVGEIETGNEQLPVLLQGRQNKGLILSFVIQTRLLLLSSAKMNMSLPSFWSLLALRLK
jgi:hypothetical protein